MFYRLFGWWVRWQACKMAALCVSAWKEEPDEGYCPKLWSTAVFFENYMIGGADGTREDFGPSEPSELHAVPESKPGVS